MRNKMPSERQGRRDDDETPPAIETTTVETADIGWGRKRDDFKEEVRKKYVEWKQRYARRKMAEYHDRHTLQTTRRTVTGYRHRCIVGVPLESNTITSNRNSALVAPQFADTIKPKMTWSPQLKTLLEGVYEARDNRDDDDDDKNEQTATIDQQLSATSSTSLSKPHSSPLSMFYNHRNTVLRHIYRHYIVPTWKDSVLLTNHESDRIAFSPCHPVLFPPPTDVNVNMLPFILGKKESLPQSLWPYYERLVLKCPLQESEIGKVLYLTVEEGWVEAGQTQRRGGLHIESPRFLHNYDKEDKGYQSPPTIRPGIVKGPPGRVGWGGGVLQDDEFVGGLYMASTVSNTCVVYHALVDKSATDDEGGLDHLRCLLPSEENILLNHQRKHSYSLNAGELVWMTDQTPHEVIPQQTRQYRQFFRLVTSSLSIWNKARSTTNDTVKVPPHVTVVDVPPR